MAPRRAARVIRAVLAVAAATVLATAGCAAVCRHITINVTPSLPRGLYWLTADHDPRRGSIVVLFPPAPFRELIAQRGYLPSSVPLLKRVVALPGDTVCTTAGRYLAAGVDLGPAASADAAGRQLPSFFPFCDTVPPGAAFVAGHGPSSLDSRYFGPVRLSTLTVVVPLWTSS
jgi:conjugative transfer signal peptidase TraF